LSLLRKPNPCQKLPNRNTKLHQINNQLVVAGTVEDLDGVGEQLGEGVERFDGAFWAAGKIEDEGNVADDGDTARQDGGGCLLGTFAAHFFGEAGNHSFGDVEGGFGRVVTGAEAGAAGGEDEIDAARIGKLAEMGAHLAWVIGALKGRGNFPAEFAAALDDSGAGEVDALAAGDGIADGENGNAHRGGQFEGTASRLASSIRRMASIRRPVVLRVVVVLEEAFAALKSISNSPSVHNKTL
jgi:hypothetical protein